MSESYKNLDLWKKAVALACDIYKLSSKFPKEELFGLTSQLRRSSVSISANVAEGSGRGSKKDYCRFVDISIGSLNETESLLFIANELGYLPVYNFKKIQDNMVELGKLLGGFRKYLIK